MKKTGNLLLILLLAIGLMQCATDPDKTNRKKIDEIISSMTLKQKAELLIGTGSHFELPDSIAERYKDRIPKNPDTLYTQMTNRIHKYLPGAAGFSAEIPDLGITCQVLADGPAGLRISPKRKGEERTYYCTAFPIATNLAATWDTELIYRVGEAMGHEVQEYNADMILGPGMNLQRDPLCGRNFEYYSEDPLITGKMGAAMVNGIQSNGVGTSIKHFAVNNQETNRMSVDAIVSERALRELYLRGFEIAVTEAQPWTVMSSYNKVNGSYASESHDLLTKILRDDWGFKGYVMTDWGAGSDVAVQMEAGNDLIMPGRPEQIKELIAAVNDGKLDESILDQNLARILNIMMKTPKYRGVECTNNPDLENHATVTREAAAQGMVLLENRGSALPIPEGMKKMAVFGTTSYEFISGGTGSGDVNEAYTISLMEGLNIGGLNVDEELAETYEAYIKAEREKGGKPTNWLAAIMRAKGPIPEMKVSEATAVRLAERSDMALITIGRNSGEGADRKPEPGDFYLDDDELMMLENVSTAFHAAGKKVVVILNIGGAIETSSWKDYPDAILCAWQPGQEGGNSVVDVITGKVNPSGKLAITFPHTYSDSPTAKNFPGHPVKSDEVDNAEDMSGFSWQRRVPWEVVYEEDIYVGYRYYNTFEVPVSYEFGYGLSYTTFELSQLALDKTKFKGELTASMTVKNTGSVAGKEVVQVYVHAPEGKLDKPDAELVAFGKTGLLQPGETETLEFKINARDLASFDEETSSWIVEPGDYTLNVGTSSLKILKTANFNVPAEVIAGTVSKAMVPQKEIDRLTSKK